MEEFKKYALKEGIEITPKILEDLKTYEKELLSWNEKFNLTGITEPEDIWHKHFLDSMTILKSIPKKSIKVIDIGTGAGFPGLVLQILNPDLHLTLMDATGKKITFLKHMIETLGLKNTEAIQNRAETLGNHPNYREAFDVAVSRAVALLPTLLEYVIPFLKIDGVFIAQKKSGTDETISAESALGALKSKIISSTPIESDVLPERQIIVIQKLDHTPSEFPRPEGLAKKRPL